jgi:hypothetical protein
MLLAFYEWQLIQERNGAEEEAKRDVLSRKIKGVFRGT